MRDISNLIVVGGAPRSGTTLVQNMLDSHPEVVGGPEFLHLKDVVTLRKQLMESIRKEWITLYCDAETVDEELRGMITRMIMSIASDNRASRVSEKTPENVLVLKELIELLPTSKFLHIVRDPRAIIASMLEVGRRARNKGERPAPFTAHVDAAINYTERCLNAGFEAEHLHPGKVYRVVYETLVRDPQQEIAKVCDFLGLEFDQQMLAPKDQKHLGEAAITQNSGELWYDKATYYSNPNADSLDKWREQLDVVQQMKICRRFTGHKELKAAGYQFDAPPVGLGTKAGMFTNKAVNGLLVRAERLLARRRESNV